MPTTWETVYAELSSEFQENCPRPLSAAAATFFRELLERNLRPLVEQNRIQWQGRERKFSLAAVAGLGRLCHEKTGSSGDVSEDSIGTATAELIPCWERICPLPSVEGEIGLLRNCRTTREMLGLPPAGAA